MTLTLSIDAHAAGMLFAYAEVAAQQPDPLPGSNAARVAAFVNARWVVDVPAVFSPSGVR